MNQPAAPDPTGPSQGLGLNLLLAFLIGFMVMPAMIALILVVILNAGDDAGGGSRTEVAAAPSPSPAPAPAQGGNASGPAPAPGPTPGGTTGGGSGGATEEESGIVVAKVNRLGDPDPFAAHWNRAAIARVPLLPQNITMPAIFEVAVEQAHVQAASDGESIAWRISWPDPTPDDGVQTDEFCDAVAVQFPMTPGTNVMMGIGGRVQILHWKAVWQKDINDGFQDVNDLHPNSYAGLYWFAEGKRPYPIDEAFDDPRARQWLIAYSAGNPMSDFEREEPCEEAVASGFGTLTTQPERATVAKGVWAYDSWAVVFKRPLQTADENDYQFTADSPRQIAFAVWQGSDGQSGGRKQWSNWVDFRIAE